MSRPFRRTSPDFFSLDDAARAERWATMADLAKRIVWLRELADASYDEIAEMLGLAVGTVRQMTQPGCRVSEETLAKVDALLARWAPSE